MMSTSKRSKRKRTKETVQQVQELSPEQIKLQELMKRLVNEATNLIVKVAVCECKNKETCPVYKGAKNIAKIVDEIMTLKQS